MGGDVIGPGDPPQRRHRFAVVQLESLPLSFNIIKFWMEDTNLTVGGGKWRDETLQFVI